MIKPMIRSRSFASMLPGLGEHSIKSPGIQSRHLIERRRPFLGVHIDTAGRYALEDKTDSSRLMRLHKSGRMAEPFHCIFSTYWHNACK